MLLVEHFFSLSFFSAMPINCFIKLSGFGILIHYAYDVHICFRLLADNMRVTRKARRGWGGTFAFIRICS